MNQDSTPQEIISTDETEQMIVATEQEESDEERNIYIEFFRH